MVCESPVRCRISIAFSSARWLTSTRPSDASTAPRIGVDLPEAFLP